MLAITTYKNPLKSAVKGYCFRSVIDQTLTSEQLIQEIIGYNSTITEADARAVLSVLNDRVKHFVRLGYRVELPFAFMHLRANGTVDRLHDGFVPGVGDHRFNVVCEFKQDALREMQASDAWRTAGVGWARLPKITELVSKDSMGKESESLLFERGSILRIKGRYLGFDASDAKQGVFFVASGADSAAAGTETRATRYHSVGPSITEVFVPAGLPDGRYKVKVVTNPRKDSLEEFTSSSEVTVGA